MILCADSEGPDQTARMRRLIWAFAVRTCPVMFWFGAAHLKPYNCNQIRHIKRLVNIQKSQLNELWSFTGSFIKYMSIVIIETDNKRTEKFNISLAILWAYVSLEVFSELHSSMNMWDSPRHTWQRRPRSACASAQSIQCLGCSLLDCGRSNHYVYFSETCKLW